MILTDKEIYYGLNKIDNGFSQKYREEWIAKAQLKKFIEWGDEICETHYGSYLYIARRQCEDCWQSLLEEIREDNMCNKCGCKCPCDCGCDCCKK